MPIRTAAKGPQKKEATQLCYLHIKEAKCDLCDFKETDDNQKDKRCAGRWSEAARGSVKSLTCEFKAADGPLDPLSRQTKALFILKQNVAIVRFESEQHLQEKKQIESTSSLTCWRKKILYLFILSFQCCV